MEKIVGQAHAEQKREQEAEESRREFAKIKTFAVSALATVVIGLGLFHVTEIQGFVTSKLAKKPATTTTTTSTAAAGQIDQIQQVAVKRDAIVEEITK